MYIDKDGVSQGDWLLGCVGFLFIPLLIFLTYIFFEYLPQFLQNFINEWGWVSYVAIIITVIIFWVEGPNRSGK